MREWQHAFEQRLEVARGQWLHRFEEVAITQVDPVYAEFDEFTRRQGFSNAAPRSAPGTRRFRFGLSDNAYLLVTFRMCAQRRLEWCAEAYAPGAEPVLLDQAEVAIAAADDRWARERFQQALDRFVGAIHPSEAEGGVSGRAVAAA